MGRKKQTANPVPYYPPTPPPPPPPPPAWCPVGVDTIIITDKDIGRLPEFKRIIQEYDPKTRKWSTSEETEETEESDDGSDVSVDEFEKFCFVFRRQIKPQGKDLPPLTTDYIEIKSYYLRRAGLDVIGNRSGVSWNAGYLELVPIQLLAYYQEFKDYLAKARGISSNEKNEDDELLISHLDIFLSFLGSEYKVHLAELEDLSRTKEINYSNLFALYKPGRLYVHNSTFTGAPEVVRLLATWNGGALTVESLDYTTSTISSDNSNMSSSSFPYIWKSEQINIPVSFFGRVASTTLPLYPLDHHPDLENLKERLIIRGKKWKNLIGIHLKYYNGTAFLGPMNKIVVQDRVMIDRTSYDQRTAPSSTPTWGNAPGNWGAPNDNWAPAPAPVIDYYNTLEPPKGTDEDLLLAPSHVYGFAFTDKRWYTFLVEQLQPVRWDPLAFEQLSMEMDRKALLQSLVEFHNKGSEFKDIVERKGRGLVVNLFGPPGTGKTLTAEALSEYVRKPLYSLTAGDLGSYSSILSENLTRIFNLAAKWDAIVLLDEADIFLETRSAHEIERNAMVSVFLKELEYFEGIIFLTTNRIEAFDKAFQSRIHVSLKYEHLTFRSRRKVWVSLLQRAGFNKETPPLSEKELDTLANTPKNGREIRNIVRTAEALAASRGESLGYRHLLQVKDVSNAFDEAQGPSSLSNGSGQSGQVIWEKFLSDKFFWRAVLVLLIFLMIVFSYSPGVAFRN